MAAKKTKAISKKRAVNTKKVASKNERKRRGAPALAEWERDEALCSPSVVHAPPPAFDRMTQIAGIAAALFKELAEWPGATRDFRRKSPLPALVRIHEAVVAHCGDDAVLIREVNEIVSPYGELKREELVGLTAVMRHPDIAAIAPYWPPAAANKVW
ncbi:MAG: hypothetical protein ACO1OB_31420 [Archangium sp.]